MTDKQMIKLAIENRKWSHKTLAREAGFKSNANVANIINTGKNSMRVDTLVKMLHPMMYELVVRDKIGNRDEYIIDMVDLDALLGD